MSDKLRVHLSFLVTCGHPCPLQMSSCDFTFSGMRRQQWPDSWSWRPLRPSGHRPEYWTRPLTFLPRTATAAISSKNYNKREAGAGPGELMQPTESQVFSLQINGYSESASLKNCHLKLQSSRINIALEAMIEAPALFLSANEQLPEPCADIPRPERAEKGGAVSAEKH